MEYKQIDYPIIDSHIHLYAASHLQDLAWGPTLPDGHVLKRQNSVEQYRAAIQSQPNLVGFVFVETDRKSSLLQDGWQYAFDEIEFLRRIKTGDAKEGEGHSAADKNLLLGVVAWAPLGAPIIVLQEYLKQVKASDDLQSKHGIIRGFRYLLQDKPRGTAVTNDFVEGLLLLEKAGAQTFDLGVDFRQGGHWQLLEAVQMLESFHKDSTGTMKIVINHFCKPNLRLTREECHTQHGDLGNWRRCVKRLSEFPMTYMKLSGFFSELPDQPEGNPTSISTLLEQTRPFVREVLIYFGPVSQDETVRIMFGSDWPVCNVGGPGPETSWQHWVALVDSILQDQNWNEAQQAMVWAGCANLVYRLGLNLAS